MKNTYLSLAAAAVFAVGCGENAATIGGSDNDLNATKQEEAWSAQDTPTLFSNTLDFTFAALPANGEAQTIPWAGNYWPTYEDNINHKWEGAGTDSPAMKYQKAFGGTNVEDQVSKYHGIDSTSGKECTDASVCDSSMGETCAKREGKDKGKCVPTWWGICHAWTPAAILLPEPKHAVTKNGVTFKVQDLKALGSLVHNSTSTKFISLRCNKQASQPDGGGIGYDEYGRPNSGSAECRDTNAGTYHVILANYLGKNKQAFAEDRTFDHEVWNQPVRGFRMTSSKEVTAQEANRLIGATSVGGTTTKKTGTVAKAAWAHQGSFPVTAGQTVKVVMTGTGDADLYVHFGAQPTEAAYTCRPYDGGSAETCEVVAPAGATAAFVSVNGYADSSNFALDITVGGAVPANYVFNARAVKFQQVTTEVDYITESSASTDGNLSARIDQYTRTDRYEYILELDAAGKIIGGEWLGSSKKNHPDFLWLPISASGSTVAGGAIKYAEVKALIDLSIADENGGGGTATEKTQVETGTLAKGVWKHYGPFNVAAGGKLTVDLTGTGDADLYVRAGSAPTATAYDCRPYKSGSTESCIVAKAGPVYVAVYGYATSSNYSAKIVWTASGGTVTPPPPATVTHLNTSGNVAQGEMKVFTIALPAGKKISINTTAAADIDLYLKAGTAPTEASFDARAWTSSGNEALTYTAPDNVTLHIGVHGYAASAFTLKTSDL